MNKRNFIQSLFGGAAGLPIVKSVERLQMSPDDTLVVTVDDYLTPQTLANLREAFKENMPGRKVMIIEKGISLSVLKSDA